jgi:uncharacterized protein (DUF1330 family)
MKITMPNIEPGQGPVLMLNMIRFRDKKVYFEQYIPAFNQVVQQLGIKGVTVKLVSEVVANIVADEHERWDEIVVVEYPSAEAFATIAQSAIYHEIANPLREAGTAELKLFMTRKTDF